MDKLNQLLKEISEVVLREEKQQEERRKRGEDFNIFSVLGLQRREVRLHSAFVAELLNPKGCHGQSDKFLKEFLNCIIGDNHLFPDTNSVKVYVEYYIGPKDGTRGGQIDILLIDDHKNAIIIENKIDARDQENQLLRYHNYAKDEHLRYLLLYLTKERTEATDFSTGKNNFDYTRIGYRNEILPWLNHCEQIAVRFPLIRETIHQYIINLNEILNIMEDQNEKDLLALMTSKNNALIINEIISRHREWLLQLFVEYIWNPLESYCKKHDLEYERKTDGVYIKRKTWNSFNIFVGSENKSNWNNAFVGIKSNQESEPKENLTCFEENPNGWWPYGWTNLPSYLGNWEEAESRKNIIEGNVTNYIKETIEKILQEIPE